MPRKYQVKARKQWIECLGLPVNSPYVDVCKEVLKATKGIYEGELDKDKAAQILYLASIKLEGKINWASKNGLTR